MNDNETNTPKEQVDAFIKEYHDKLGITSDEMADFVRGVGAIRCRAKERSHYVQVFIEKCIEYLALGFIALLGYGFYHLGEAIVADVIARGH